MNLKSSIGIYSMCVSYLEGERKGMEEFLKEQNISCEDIAELFY